MNFLKRAGAILMLVAVFASSCNKYADDFKQINTKLDALAAAVVGVTQLTTDNATLKAQITALQTAVAALPTTASITALSTGLAGVVVKIDAITTTLNTVALAGTATKAVVDGLKTDLAALKTKVDADNAALKLQITALGTTDTAQSAQLTALVASNATILTSITTLQTSLAGLASGSDATALTIQGLQLMLDAQKLQLEQILLNTSMYNGDVNLTTDAEVTFYMGKLGQLAIVNGNVTVDKSAITSAQLANVATVTSKITAVIGTGNVDVKFKAGDAINFSNLVSVKGTLTVTGSTKGAGADVDLSKLDNVGGTVTLSYDGAYASASLKKVGGDLILVNKAVASASTPLGTTSINLPNVVVTGKVDDVVVSPATGVVVFPLATDVILAGGVSSLTADVATNIKLGSATYSAGIAISSSLTAAATIDLSAATGITGAGSIVGFGGTTVNLAGLKTATGGLTVTTGSTGAVTLTAYNEPTGTLTVTGPKTLVLPAMAAGPIVSTTAETVTLNVHDWVIPATINAVKTLTCGAVTKLVTLPASTVTAVISGKVTTAIPQTTTAGVTSTGSTKLVSVTVGGTLNNLVLSGATVLTTVVTAGVVNEFTLNDCDAVVGITLAHKHYEGGTGSKVIVTNNLLLASLTTSCEEMAVLQVQNNAALATANFASYITRTVSGNPTITINGNALTGDYVKGIAATITTPYVECKITSAAFTTLKTYIALHTAPTLSMDLDNVSLAGAALPSPAVTLTARMAADSDATAEWNVAPTHERGNDGSGAITNLVEMTHVQ